MAKSQKSQPVPRLLRVDMTEAEVLTMLRLASLGAAVQAMLLTVAQAAESDGDELTIQETIDLERAQTMMQRTTDQVMRMERDEIIAWNTFVDKLHTGVFAAFGIRAVNG